MKALVFLIVVSITTVLSRPSFPTTHGLSQQSSSHECDYPTLDNQVWRWCYLPLYGRLVGWFYPSPYTYGGGYYYPLITNGLETWYSYPYDSNHYSIGFQPYVDEDTTQQTVWRRPITTADYITKNNAVNIFVGNPFVGKDDKPPTYKEPETIPDKNEMTFLTSKLINILKTLFSTHKEDAENDPPKKTVKTDAEGSTMTNFQKEVSQEIEYTGDKTVEDWPQVMKTQIINEGTEKTVPSEGMAGVPQEPIETAAREEPKAAEEMGDMKIIPHKNVPEDAPQNAPVSNVPQSEPSESETPQEQTPENDTPMKVAPEGYAPEKDAPMKVAPEGYASESDVPEKHASQSDALRVILQKSMLQRVMLLRSMLLRVML
ncbi:uncharacterized protein LOC123508389 [Portunus trituberculatus]|uniref:uncharacterized protein LOC123508389 n=1 Tax=Portunus trituberculatus TaxID=210409 RepID=UPI001E1CFD16|nr:uncharacterized protein LOC123508389 [Portunus trituberculatus]